MSRSCLSRDGLSRAGLALDVPRVAMNGLTEEARL